MESVAAKPLTRSAESTDHFVCHQKDLVAAADIDDFRPIGFGWYDHTACALNRFGNECCYPMFAQLFNFLF